MKVSTIVSDLDFTMTDESLVLRSNVVGFVQRLRRLGIDVVLASGKDIYTTYSIATYIGATPAAVAENGGVICIDHKVEVLGDISGPMEAYEVLHEEMGERIRKAKVFPRLTGVVLERGFDINKARRILKEAGLNVSIVDTRVNCHLMQAGIEKWKGLVKVLNKICSDREGIIAVGDSLNDLSLFENADFRIAVGNAVAELKKLAEYTTKNPGGAGLIEGVSHLLSLRP